MVTQTHSIVQKICDVDRQTHEVSIAVFFHHNCLSVSRTLLEASVKISIQKIKESSSLKYHFELCISILIIVLT